VRLEIKSVPNHRRHHTSLRAAGAPERCAWRTKMTTKCLVAFLLTATCALADHNAVQLDALILGLPDGWIVTIARPNHLDSCGNRPLFEMTCTMPDVEYEHDTKAGRLKEHPSLTLMFHRPLSAEKEAAFKTKAAEVDASPQAVAPPRVLAKTENYWVMSYQTEVRFDHPKVKELYDHLKTVLAVNRKE
jgi:hypothetical protein